MNFQAFYGKLYIRSLLYFYKTTIGGVNMAKTCRQLRHRNSLSGFYRFAQNLATTYASSGKDKARSVLMNEFDVTESTYYTLLEMSITHHLVDDNTAGKIKEKILANQTAHGNHGTYSEEKYNKLMEARKNYSAFTKKDIRYIATYFANHPEIPKDTIAKTFSFHNTRALEKVLLRACMELIISDKVFQKLKKRGLDNATDLDKTTTFFNKLTEYRAYIKGLKEKAKLSV